MIATGSSTFGLKMFGPKTVAKFCTLILFTPEYDWTSSRNLANRKILTFHDSIMIINIIIYFNNRLLPADVLEKVVVHWR